MPLPSVMKAAQSTFRIKDPEQRMAIDIGALGPANLKKALCLVLYSR